MNRAHDYAGLPQNQLTALSTAGYFTTAVGTVHTLPAFAPATDTSASREHRVRSYLAVNCIQCHQPGGVALGPWDARPTTPTDAASLIGGTLANNGGDPLNRWAVPGDTAHSMILKRLQGIGVQRMPPLATSELDPSAIALLTDWITLDLPTRQSLTQWQTLHFGSPGAANAALTADPDLDGQSNAFEFLARTLPSSPAARWAFTLEATGGNWRVGFTQPANRALLIETSADLITWTPWDVPGNAPTSYAMPQVRTLAGPMSGAQRFFRARLTEP